MNTQAIEKTSPLPASSKPLTPEGILQLGLGFWASKTLLSAVELGVFTELGHGPLSADDLIARLGLHRRSAYDFLDALVALGMLERGSGRYANTPATDLFLDRNKQAYVGGMLEMANARLYPFWAGLTDALKTGQPQNEVKRGGDFFGGSLLGPRPARRVPEGDDRDQCRFGNRDREDVSLGEIPNLCRHRSGARWADVTSCAGTPASPRGGIRSSGGSTAFRGIHRPPQIVGPGPISGR